MRPTCAIYQAAEATSSVVVAAGAKGLRLAALGIARSGDGKGLGTVREQCASAAYEEAVLALESSQLALAFFPVEPSESEAVVREQVELEIVQQFLSSPDEGYSADVYLIGPDLDGHYTACALCLFGEQRHMLERVEHVVGVAPVRVVSAALGAAAAFAYNYPERYANRCAVAVIGAESVDLLVVHKGTVVWWQWLPVAAAIEPTLERLVRAALLHAGELSALFAAGSGLTSARFEQLRIAFDGRFPEPVEALNGFRLVECGVESQLCRAAARLAHLYAPAVGAALCRYMLAPCWHLESPTVPA